MPAKKATTKPVPGKKPSGLTRIYLFLYNLVSLGLWASCTLRTALLIPQHLEQHGSLSAIFAQVFPLLALTQSLAALEIVHSLVGLVRAPVVTTAMQVASRFLVVWGVMFAFHEGSDYTPEGAGILGAAARDTQYGDYGFLGCMFAWGITECIRYGFFAMQLAGVGVPGFWLWLRYVFFCLFLRLLLGLIVTVQIQHLLRPLSYRNLVRVCSHVPRSGAGCSVCE